MKKISDLELRRVSGGDESLPDNLISIEDLGYGLLVNFFGVFFNFVKIKGSPIKLVIQKLTGNPSDLGFNIGFNLFGTLSNIFDKACGWFQSN